MSSLISQIFYGSKQHIIDNYLLNQDQSHSITRHPNYSQVLNLTSKEDTSKNYQILFEFYKLQQNHLYCIHIYIGPQKITNYVPTTQHGQTLPIVLTNLTTQFIYQHKSLKVEVIDGKGIKTKKSLAHIPMEIIIQSINSLNNHSITSSLMMIGNLPIKKIIAKITVVQSNDTSKNIHQQYYHPNQSFSKTSQQKIKLTQNQIKTIKFKFIDYFFNFPISQISDIQIAIKQLDGKYIYYSKQQQIIIHAIGQDGITMDVCVQSKRIGFIHLNTLILLSQYIQGEFPILNDDGIFLGRININPIECKQNPFKNPKQNYSKIKNFQNTQQQQPNLKTNKSFILLNFCQILLFVQTSKMDLFYKDYHQSNHLVTMIIRSVSTLSQFTLNIKQLKKGFFSLSTNQRLYLANHQLIISDNNQYPYFPIQIQIYKSKILISYSKFLLNKQQNTQMQFYQGLIDGGCEGYIVQIYHQSWIILYSQAYFLDDKIQNIIQILLSNQLISFITKNSQKYQVIQKWITKLHQIGYRVTYIECQRLFNLIIKNYCSTVQRFNSHAISFNRSIPKQFDNILQQLIYLDPHFLGLITYQAWQQIHHYYRLDSRTIWTISFNNRNYVDQILVKKQKYFGNQFKIIPYLFLLLGFRLLKKNIEKTQLTQLQPQLFETYNPTLQITKKHEFQINDQKADSVYVRQISCKNLHYLIPLNKIPSCYISLNPKIISYSNSNPTFKIGKFLNQGQKITFFHKNIKNNVFTQLFTIFLDIHKQIYQINDRVTVNLAFLNKKQQIVIFSD